MKLKLFFLPFTLVLALVLIIWFIKPGWGDYQIKKGELEELLEEKQQLDKGLAQLNVALDNYEFMDNKTKQLIMNAMPTDKNNDDLIAEIHKNVLNSGVFLSGTKLKGDNVSARSRSSSKKNNKSTSPERKETTVEVEVIGNYLNVKSFIEKVDFENRLSIPKEVSLSRLQRENISEEEPGPDDLVKAQITFSIFEKKKDPNISLSKLSSTNDEIIKSLLASGLKMEVVEGYQEAVTSTLFIPVTMEGAGKQDIFAR